MARQGARRDANAAPIADLMAEMTAALESVGIFVGAEVNGGTVVVSGEVDSDENRQAAMDIAEATLGRSGMPLVDAIEVMEIAPDSPFETSPTRTTDRYWDADPAGVPFDPDRSPMGIDPDFTDDLGTTDPQVAAAEGVPYYPPTDPVVRPSKGPQELSILNGFAPGATDDPGLGNAPRGDDEIASDVARALRDDAATTDLAVTVAAQDGVVVLRGEVATLEDAENAEAVAGIVAGVVEVREEIAISSMMRGGS